MTVFIDVPISLDPRHPDALNPAFAYLSWVSWSQATALDQEHRDRLVATMSAAIYKQAGHHMPPSLPRIRRENIHATANRAVHRICRSRLPAAFMVLSRFAERGLVDLMKRDLAISAAELCAAGAIHRDEIVPLRVLHDIGKDNWLDARPALAMTMALPVLWTASKSYVAAYEQVALLFTRHDWVWDAMRNAQALALQLEHVFDPPALLVPRPRIVRSDARYIRFRKAAILRLLNVPKRRGS